MKGGDNLYVWQNKNWPHWQYNAESLMPLLAQVHQALGHLLGRMRDQGMSSQAQATLEALTEDVLKTSEIEGEHLDAEIVRSSIARRLGVDVGALMPADRHVDGVVEMILDATSLHSTPLTTDRLTAWHAALFPTGRSGLATIRVGAWRDDADGAIRPRGISGRCQRCVNKECACDTMLRRQHGGLPVFLLSDYACGHTLRAMSITRASFATAWS